MGDPMAMTSKGQVTIPYVLLSPRFYARSRAEVAVGLRAVLGHRSIHLLHKPSVLQAIDRWEQTRKLVVADCLVIAHALRDHAGVVYSYDRDVGRVEGFQRVEPEAESDK